MTIIEKRNTFQYVPSLRDLLPGGMSVGGFLAEGQTLDMVVQRDRRALKVLGYTHREVADLLGTLCEKAALERFTYDAPNGKKFTVRVISYRGIYRGTQDCPWRDRVDWRRSPGSSDIYVREDGKDEETEIPGLLRHLIEEHEFFEGGSRRIAPERIVELFGIERIPGSIEQAKQLTF